MSITAHGITKSFQGREVLKNIDLDLAEGRFYCLLGGSGSGKTTLLRILSGLEKVDAGNIQRKSDKLRQSFIFQEPNLLPWLTVKDNILLPYSFKKNQVPAEELKQRMKGLMALLKIGHTEELFPHQLSGGMKMRVSIARSLISSPDVVYCDEPFAALDEQTRDDLQEVFKEICDTLKTTVVFVTHSTSEAAFLGSEILVINQHKNIERIQNPLSDPRNLRSNPEYFSFSNMLRNKLKELSN